MTDLVALAAELLPGAAWVGGRPAAPEGPEGAGRSIAWVRILRARVPAFDALDPGDLVIAPASALAVVAPGESELRELVAALAAVPVSGVLLVEGEAGEVGHAGAAREPAGGVPVVGAPRAVTSASTRPPNSRSKSTWRSDRPTRSRRPSELSRAQMRRRGR